MTFSRMFGLVLGLGLVAMVGACGDDDDGGETPDAPLGTTFDARPATFDARPGAGPDSATGVMQRNVPLTRAQEVPLCTSGGSGAGGDAVVTISADGSTIQVTGSFAMLSGGATMMHIHYGAEQAMGPVVLDFGTPVTPFNKTFTAADYMVKPNAPADFATFVTELKTMSKGYINVHTAACTGGEIRGQIK